tara:strand:- start:160 stop:270 length:111 start_codon:yes stop_codon:yes gene_type:complete
MTLEIKANRQDIDSWNENGFFLQKETGYLILRQEKE